MPPAGRSEGGAPGAGKYGTSGPAFREPTRALAAARHALGWVGEIDPAAQALPIRGPEVRHEPARIDGRKGGLKVPVAPAVRPTPPHRFEVVTARLARYLYVRTVEGPPVGERDRQGAGRAAVRARP